MAEGGADNGWQQGAETKALSSGLCSIYHLDARSPLRLWTPHGMSTFCGCKDNPLGLWIKAEVVLFWFLRKVCCLYPLAYSASRRPLFASEHLPTGNYVHGFHGRGQ